MRHTVRTMTTKRQLIFGDRSLEVNFLRIVLNQLSFYRGPHGQNLRHPSWRELHALGVVDCRSSQIRGGCLSCADRSHPTVCGFHPSARFLKATALATETKLFQDSPWAYLTTVLCPGVCGILEWSTDMRAKAGPKISKVNLPGSSGVPVPL
jgi:hypothetical protein